MSEACVTAVSRPQSNALFQIFSYCTLLNMMIQYFKGCSQLRLLPAYTISTAIPLLNSTAPCIPLRREGAVQPRSPSRIAYATCCALTASRAFTALPREWPQPPQESMLSRYRSPSRVDFPRGPRAVLTNNPITSFQEAIQHFPRRDLLRTELRLWDGPLAGVAHQGGQLPALEEGPAAEAAKQPPLELAQALSQDLELLGGLAELTQVVSYDAGGSESDFALLPLLLEPRPQRRGAAEAAAAVETPAAEAVEAADACCGGLRPSAVAFGEAGAVGAGGIGGGGSEGGSAGAWWDVAAVRAVRLSAAEVAASLGIAPELAIRMQLPLEFDSRDAFLSHMVERHIRRLAGAETDPSTSAGAMAAAVRGLAESVSYPVLQVMVGGEGEGLAWNPKPLLWVGRSSRSGALLGLLTAVVWT